MRDNFEPLCHRGGRNNQYPRAFSPRERPKIQYLAHRCGHSEEVQKEAAEHPDEHIKPQQAPGAHHKCESGEGGKAAVQRICDMHIRAGPEPDGAYHVVDERAERTQQPGQEKQR